MTFNPQNIHLLAALPQEYRSFQRLFSRQWVLEARSPFSRHCCTRQNTHFHLTETGMGRHAVCRALDWILSSPEPPDLLVSFGFAGSLSPHLKVGDVCLVERVCIVNDEQTSSKEYETGYAEGMKKFAHTNDLKITELITVKRPEPKDSLAALTGGRDALVDMESFYIAEAAFTLGIPLVCLRSVSDGFHDSIVLDLDFIVDQRGRVSPLKVCFQILKKPSIFPFILKSWKQSSRASASLAGVLNLMWNESPGIWEALWEPAAQAFSNH